MLRRSHSTADAVTLQQHAVFTAGGSLVLHGRVVPREAGIQPDLRRQQELAVLAIAGAAGVDLGKAPDVVAGKIAGVLAAFGIGGRIHRCIGPLRTDDGIAFIVHAVAQIHIAGQIGSHIVFSCSIHEMIG